jgi:murein DD-endopeptidase MepM/ murein hydrolase activator NlpD
VSQRRRWTILVVPHDTETPRQFEIGERGVRVATGLAAGLGLIVLIAGLMLFSPWATPGARLVSRENRELAQEIERLDAALVQLGDSIGMLADREREFRALAGITTVDSARAEMINATRTAPKYTMARAGMTERPRPFAAYFGNDTRPDVDQLLRQASELSDRFAIVADSMAERIERLRNTPSIMPTTGWLSGAFSRARLHPILHELRPHEGIDVSAPKGTPIVAPAGGRVKRVGVERGYGNTVEIDHGNGIVTRYAHCSRIIVRAGQRVERGQMIATVGNTGLSAGPHLHYEIHINGRPVNPLTYVLPEGATP